MVFAKKVKLENLKFIISFNPINLIILDVFHLSKHATHARDAPADKTDSLGEYAQT